MNQSDKTVDAVCINCNKRFNSIRSVSMHLKATASRHVVNFIDYGNYDKKTGLRESPEYIQDSDGQAHNQHA
jgi:hypothetical protein